jgi:hypothetical protein
MNGQNGWAATASPPPRWIWRRNRSMASSAAR